jgi:hypothetical protein
MAIEEKIEGRIIKTLFGEKADRVVTFLTAGAGLGYVGKEIWKRVFGKVAEKGLDAAEKHVSKALGLDTVEEAKKTLNDEFLYRVALHGISEDTANEKRKKLNEFRADLKKSDKTKAEAYVLFVAKMLAMHAKDKKKSKKLGKGKDAPREEEVSKFYEFTYTNEFFNDLLARETFKAKIEFLEDENVFSLIPPEKKLLKSIEDAGKRIADKIAAKKKTAGTAPEVLEKNAKDWVSITSSWKTKAQQWRDAANNQNNNQGGL